MKLEFNDCIGTLHLTPNPTKENTRSADASKQHSVSLSLNGQNSNKKEDTSS